MNPYASYLGDRNALEVVAATPQRLATIVEALGPDGMERSFAPGKWSARSILCHLADTEVVFAFRFRQALAESHHVIQPYDQEAWSRPYSSLKTDAALEAFSAVRRWNLALIGTVPTGEFSKPVTHPERGQMTFEVLLQTMAGHDLNHLKQLERISSGIGSL